MQLVKIISTALLLSILAGCASIAGNHNRAVRVTSNPSGAAIYVDNQQRGVTPAVITLPSDIYGGKNVTLRKHGFQDQTLMVNTKFQPVALLDVFFWPTFIVDYATGSLVKIDPAYNQISGNLQRA